MTTTVSATIDKRLEKKVKRLAKSDQTTKSGIVKKALIEYIEDRDLTEEYNSRKPMVVKEVANNEYLTLDQLEKSLRKK